MENNESYKKTIRDLKYSIIGDIASCLESEPDKSYHFKKPIAVFMSLGDTCCAYTVDAVYLDDNPNSPFPEVYLIPMVDGGKLDVHFLVIESVSEIYANMNQAEPCIAA